MKAVVIPLTLNRCAFFFFWSFFIFSGVTDAAGQLRIDGKVSLVTAIAVLACLLCSKWFFPLVWLGLSYLSWSIRAGSLPVRALLSGCMVAASTLICGLWCLVADTRTCPGIIAIGCYDVVVTL